MSLMVVVPPHGVVAVDAVAAICARTFRRRSSRSTIHSTSRTDARSGRGQCQRPAAGPDIDRLASLSARAWARAFASASSTVPSISTIPPCKGHSSPSAASRPARRRPRTRRTARRSRRCWSGSRTDRPLPGCCAAPPCSMPASSRRAERGPVASSADFSAGGRLAGPIRRDGHQCQRHLLRLKTRWCSMRCRCCRMRTVILVAAAGNRGPKGPPAYPAAIDSAFAVTAVSLEGDAYRHANIGDYIDIAAPGHRSADHVAADHFGHVAGGSVRDGGGRAHGADVRRYADRGRSSACRPMPAISGRAAAIRVSAGGCCRRRVATAPQLSARHPCRPSSCVSRARRHTSLGGTPSAFLNMVVKAAGLS